MLVDRSLRLMAGFTAVCAITMFIIVLSYFPAFVKRRNPHSTAVGGKEGEGCDVMEKKNVVGGKQFKRGTKRREKLIILQRQFSCS
jgi:hypothetical protein